MATQQWERISHNWPKTENIGKIWKSATPTKYGQNAF